MCHILILILSRQRNKHRHQTGLFQFTHCLLWTRSAWCLVCDCFRKPPHSLATSCPDTTSTSAAPGPGPTHHITSHSGRAGSEVYPPSLRMFSASDQCSVTVTVLCLCKCLIPTPVAAQTKHGRGSVCERR